jgi:hypothetical protein
MADATHVRKRRVPGCSGPNGSGFMFMSRLKTHKPNPVTHPPHSPTR